MVLGAPVSGLAAGLAFDGSTSGPVTTKSALIIRMVSVVIDTHRWARQNAHRNDPSLNPS